MDARLVLLIDIDSLIWFLGEDVVATGSSRLSNPKNVRENDKFKPKNKKEKKKTKVQQKEKRESDESAGKTKSKKFHRRFLSLFCCCFKSQETNEN